VSVLLIVLPLALVLAGLGVAAFIWMARTGQLDDLETPAMRVLFDDDEKAPKDRSES
jgi:cbb3-type cytochrome oxidase maturation protein